MPEVKNTIGVLWLLMHIKGIDGEVKQIPNMQ
jgi:hypothetical protein